MSKNETNNKVQSKTNICVRGYDLDKLLNDKDINVLFNATRRDFCLGKFLDDKDTDILCDATRRYLYIMNVRLEAAKQGKYLDRLVDDKDPAVRLEVAKQGEYLDRLVDDEDPDVREMARKKLAEQQSQK